MQDRYMRRRRPRILGIERKRPDLRPNPDDGDGESPGKPDPGKLDDC